MKPWFLVALGLVACKSEKAPPAEPAPATTPTAPSTPPTTAPAATPSPAPTPPPPAPAAETKTTGQCRFVELEEATKLLEHPTKWILREDKPDLPCRVGTTDKSELEITMDLSGVYSPEIITGEAVPDVGEKAAGRWRSPRRRRRRIPRCSSR